MHRAGDLRAGTPPAAWTSVGWSGTVRQTSLIRHITVDSSDPYRLAQFWAAVLGGSLAEDDFPGDPEASVTAGDTTLLFVSTPDAKTAKNRVHLDLQPPDQDRDDEVERVLALGARLVSDCRRPDGSGWVTLADVEGNEFCVERSARSHPRRAPDLHRPEQQLRKDGNRPAASDCEDKP